MKVIRNVEILSILWFKKNLLSCLYIYIYNSEFFEIIECDDTVDAENLM